ncbi:MAG: ATP synthase F1 subunit epsilon [Candidatus Peribacteraceae bacterium]|nr:ATP synthase F1 subunit epsilon [Candidatus Peribacteraceae bacterium]
MTKAFKLTVLSAERELYSGEAAALTAPTELGEVTVMANHIPLVANLHAGELTIQKAGGGNDYLFAGGGVLEFTPENECRVLADAAERVEEIDAKRAEAARERAQKAIEEAESEPEVAEAQAALLRALARLRIAEKNRKLRGRH